ncbi:MAG TPA: hypothetical protein VK714_08955 [Myxococcota bacterium]|nr:hypothetical protein [Myxococcota bacterium]
MLQDIVKNISSPDRSLRSVGLVRASQTYGALNALSAFALGLVIGASLALLLAPLSGPELRKRVQAGVNGRDNPLVAH